ncbi:MAG: GNAT family N-acetyltransferase [Spirochaetota bacterium]
MSFELTQEVVDQVIFGMENQEHDFVVDVKTGHVGRAEEMDSGVETEPIPEWHSVDGYNLMERFVADLRNPVVREQLRSILASGRGVFRSFKDTLKEYPEVERLWFRFKEREMRRVVYEWYNALRDQWGLERVPMDLETDTENLILADFTFELDTLSHEETRQYAHDAREEVLSDLSIDVERRLMEDLEKIDDGADLRSVSAVTPQDEVVGVAAAVVHRDRAPAVGVVNVLFVEPEYRGLGVARELLNRLCGVLDEAGVPTIHIELPGQSRALRSMLEAWDAEEISRRYRLDIHRWAERRLFDD